MQNRNYFCINPILRLLAFLHEQAISATDHRYGNLLPYQQDLTGGRGWERGAQS
ncbi:hypothetical protein [Herbaspirillum sp. VT-16-41]|uniref:hypothetical protein n=1 Tax=Herbaspirillum sp. VT-16-41 TaxID=1953765 RepID=UPI00143DEAF9|nr:hypothetical protein [Herbaspirillum sp. VT-16-41]